MTYAFTVSRANTVERAKLLLSTLTIGQQTAGAPFYWHLFAPEHTKAADIARSAHDLGLIQAFTLYPENVGQHVAWNDAFELAVDNASRYFLRLDDDIEFKSKRWLERLLEASEAFDDTAVISPAVRGLRNPPPVSSSVMHKGIEVRFAEAVIGGICRLHPVALLERHNYVSDVRLPLGSGDAAGMGRWCIANTVPMVYLAKTTVRHALSTEGQERGDPSHFASHGVFQCIPYIPAYRTIHG